MKFVALDFETSSKSTERGCPLQLGVAVMDGENVLASDEWLIKVPTHYKSGKPTREVDAYALQINGLTLEKIEREGLTHEASCDRLAKLCAENNAGGLPVLAYSSQFDQACYRDMLFLGSRWHATEKGVRVAYPEVLHYVWMDGLALARKRLTLDSYKLSDVAAHLSLSPEGTLHTALTDCVLAGRVFSRLMVPK